MNEIFITTEFTGDTEGKEKMGRMFVETQTLAKIGENGKDLRII
jgi:hypothetical protein